ncbi:hypothetical protein HJC99_05865 [Candidatus Saccharibacteria bacterium]|nr:hypothetical protein [Candidatus Saccharibacteria bacterium]
MSGAGPAVAYTSGTYGSGTYGLCEYGVTCSISLSSDGNISLNVIPTSSGSCTIQSDSPTVLTDDTNGYTLSLADSGTGTSLLNGAAAINATSGTIASPTALTGNSWGYRVDGLGSFGSGPTTSQTNVAPSSTVFAGIQPSDLIADTIATTSGAADPAVATTVWFGTCANTSVPSGAYTTQVIYTAVAN